MFCSFIPTPPIEADQTHLNAIAVRSTQLLMRQVKEISATRITKKNLEFFATPLILQAMFAFR